MGAKQQAQRFTSCSTCTMGMGVYSCMTACKLHDSAGIMKLMVKYM